MAKITVTTGSPKFPVTESLYGLFFEDINRSGDGGLYPEMLRNRTFEDSLIPQDCVAADENHDFFLSKNGWKGNFTHGEGLARWPEQNKTPYTPIPAWYGEKAELSLDAEDVLNAKRLVSLKAVFEDGGKLYNIGYRGVPAQKGRAMKFYMFAKPCCEKQVKVKIESACGCTVYAEKAFTLKANGYVRYDAVLIPNADDKNARFVIEAPEALELHLGFISLMPADTYNGHGLRTDLVEKLAALKPAFMRFPGGCIVEGFNSASLLRFSNMIGNVWERPTNWNLWAYRTSNGLGFHEWLQLCEDLNMKKMWVFNCGMTCQGREPEYFTGAEFDALLQQAIDAIEYATAPVGTKWGDVRAAAGHPAPFGMDYVEIGNENSGPAYNTRYAKCYEVLKARYPFITFVSNTHTEKFGLPTQIVDEHFYSTPEFFAENVRKYDKYPRKAEGGPAIFVGEYAVTAGQPGSLRAALGEAMFLMGMERNQDIVKLASYAPLFENVSFYNWYPNLICFDNTHSYGIPSWHMLKLMGGNRGKQFVDAKTESEICYKPMNGVFALLNNDAFSFRNARIDGAAAAVEAELLGGVQEEGGVYTTFAGEADHAMFINKEEAIEMANATCVLLGSEAKESSTFEVSVDFKGALTLQAFVRKMTRRGVDVPWSFRNARGCIWKIADGKSVVGETRFMESGGLAPEKELKLAEGWHDFKIVTYVGGFDCYIDGELIQKAALPFYHLVEAVADTNDDEVIVKIVNFSDKEQDIDVALDIDVKADYTLKLLTGDPLAGNSIDDPENVKAVESAETGAARTFVYKAPANSLSVLILKK